MPKTTHKFTNVQQKRMLLKLCNRLYLKPMRVCQSLHSCVLCGEDITLGQEYRDGGYGARAHKECITRTVLECVK